MISSIANGGDGIGEGLETKMCDGQVSISIAKDLERIFSKKQRYVCHI